MHFRRRKSELNVRVEPAREDGSDGECFEKKRKRMRVNRRGGKQEIRKVQVMKGCDREKR